jgi:transposase
MQALKHHVEKYPSPFQRERAKHFGVSKSAMFYALRRLRMSYKKNTATPQGRCPA